MAGSAQKNFQIAGEPKKISDACSNQEMRQAEFFFDGLNMGLGQFLQMPQKNFL